jgi:hypothetical protein
MTKDELWQVREWANSKLATGDEPPWSWYQYMKLREALDGVILGLGSVSPTASLQQPEASLGKHLRLVGDTDSRDTAPLRPSDVSVQLPM